MANSQHITWLLEGVTAWNARHAESDFRPQLDGVDLREICRGTSLEGINLRQAYLRNSNLDSLNLANADLADANLQGASLFYTDLRGAQLSLANFMDAFLGVANLKGARAGGATFDRANLSAACLDDAFLGKANFHGANLVNANFNNADLRDASLVDANVTGAELWKASFYQHSKHNATVTSQLADSVTKVGELTEIVDSVVRHYTASVTESDIDMPLLYFRGEALGTWDLRPALTRPPSDHQLDVRGREGEMLLDLMSRRPEEFSHLRSALSEWVLAQHYGLKTRLLDVSRNPLVGLFSACDDSPSQDSFTDEDGVLHVFVVPRELVKSFDSDSVSVITNFAKLPLFEQKTLLGKRDQTIKAEMEIVGREPPTGDLHSKFYGALTRLYHNIGREKPHFKERIEPRDLYRVFIVEPEQSLERVRAQSAAFLVSAFHERFEPSHVLAWTPDIPMYEHYRFKIPAQCKKSILQELQLLNMTRETLFPGLEEATQAVMRQHGRKGGRTNGIKEV